MGLTKENLETILKLLIAHEHIAEYTREELYVAMRVAQIVEAPQFITEYFARKQLTV